MCQKECDKIKAKIQAKKQRKQEILKEQKEEAECIICGCPLSNDEELGYGCVNGACPTNYDAVKDYEKE